MSVQIYTLPHYYAVDDAVASQLVYANHILVAAEEYFLASYTRRYAYIQYASLEAALRRKTCYVVADDSAPILRYTALGNLTRNVWTLEELLENIAYKLWLGTFHSVVALPCAMLYSLYSTPASPSVRSRRCLLQSVINIWPKSSPPTSFKS